MIGAVCLLWLINVRDVLVKSLQSIKGVSVSPSITTDGAWAICFSARVTCVTCGDGRAPKDWIPEE